MESSCLVQLSPSDFAPHIILNPTKLKAQNPVEDEPSPDACEKAAPQPSKVKALVDAPVPAVNIWQQRREAQAAKKPGVPPPEAGPTPEQTMKPATVEMIEGLLQQTRDQLYRLECSFCLGAMLGLLLRRQECKRRLRVLKKGLGEYAEKVPHHEDFPAQKELDELRDDLYALQGTVSDWKRYASVDTRRPGLVYPADDCDICLESLTGGMSVILPCGHVMHSRCALEWLHNAMNCPHCRREVTETDVWCTKWRPAAISWFCEAWILGGGEIKVQ